jgi:hypothetical protein
MNNEPVFWACGLEEDEAVSNALKIKLGLEYYNIPLYTHPVKELTDEEIDECLYSTDWSYDPHSFARAILRKVQE